jgi:ADP-heptose:LPS heptosyltransferase
MIGLFEKTQLKLGIYEHQVMGPLRAVAEHPEVILPMRNEVRFPLCFNLNDVKIVDQLLHVVPKSGKQSLIAIFPGGTFSHKIWPIEKFVSVVKALSHQSEYHFVIIGLKEDRKKAEEIAAVIPQNYTIACGDLQIPSLADLLSRCALFLGNDSGPLHVAAAVGCPCVSIMSGIEHPVFWSPWGSENLVQRVDIWCSPCRAASKCPKGNPVCVTSISVDVVIEACWKALSRSVNKRS